MYFIAASNVELQERLKKKGLKPPKRSFSINTTSGEKLPIKTVSQINAIVNSRKKPVTPKYNYSSYTQNYKNAKVYFSTISPKDNNNTLPPTSKRYSSFKFYKAKGGKIWVYVDNSTQKLNTSQVKVYVYKKVYTSYIRQKTLSYNTTGSWKNMYFPFTFYEAGSYKMMAYSKEGKYIGTGYFSTSLIPD